LTAVAAVVDHDDTARLFRWLGEKVGAEPPGHESAAHGLAPRAKKAARLDVGLEVVGGQAPFLTADRELDPFLDQAVLLGFALTDERAEIGLVLCPVSLFLCLV
jgi:hypothetical protein